MVNLLAANASLSSGASEPEITEPTALKRGRGRPRKSLEMQGEGNRRDALLAHAAKLFRKKGFGSTSTRDIAAAAGMHSGSPFYHFESKQSLLFEVMNTGLRSALTRQQKALERTQSEVKAQKSQAEWKTNHLLLHTLIRNHFEVLLGVGNDFIPVMLYESRSITFKQRKLLATLQSEYEAQWIPILTNLHLSGHLKTDVKLARLLLFGALNWSVQWFDRKQNATLDDLTRAVMALFIGNLHK